MITKLTHKQILFCEGYIKSLNATKSVIDAGYKTKNPRQFGHGLLNKKEIKEYIDNALNKKVDDAIASKEEVMKMFTKILRREEEEEYFYEGKTYKCKPSLNVVIKAGTEILNRYDIVKDDKIEGLQIIIER